MNVPVKIYLYVFVAAIFLAVFTLPQWVLLSDGKLHVLFCDVGQGDAIFIRTPSGKNILVDGGPNDSVLDCLSSHMVFWDRTLSIVALTHPHADHLMGFLDVFKRYTVNHFITEDLHNKTQGFAQLENLIRQNNIPKRFVSKGDTMQTSDGVSVSILGPTNEFLEATSPNGAIGESQEFGSLITLVSFGKFRVLLTGDSQSAELFSSLSSEQRINVLQVPHHGSATGLTKDILDLVSPSLAVISVGAKNRYGHPKPETINLLQEEGIAVLRTDQNGEVEIISDGKTFSVKKSVSGTN